MRCQQCAAAQALALAVDDVATTCYPSHKRENEYHLQFALGSCIFIGALLLNFGAQMHNFHFAENIVLLIYVRKKAFRDMP